MPVRVTQPSRSPAASPTAEAASSGPGAWLSGGSVRCRCLASGMAASSAVGCTCTASSFQRESEQHRDSNDSDDRSDAALWPRTDSPSCSRFTQSRTFAELAADASAVPVPTGVAFVRESRSVEDGPGFTTATYKEVSRLYVSEMSCQEIWSTTGQSPCDEHIVSSRSTTFHTSSAQSDRWDS